MNDLDLALWNVKKCASVEKHCAALLAELQRLYTAAGEPIPATIRPSWDYVIPDDQYVQTVSYEVLHEEPKP